MLIGKRIAEVASSSFVQSRQAELPDLQQVAKDFAGWLSGRIDCPENKPPWPMLHVTALNHDNATLAEGITTPKGDFILPFQNESDLLGLLFVRIDDKELKKIASFEMKPATQREACIIPVDPAALQSASSDYAITSLPPLLDPDTLAHLERELFELVSGGQIEAAVLEAYANAVRSLRWLEALLDDAGAVLSGNVDAAERWRNALLEQADDLPPNPARQQESQEVWGSDQGVVSTVFAPAVFRQEAAVALIAATIWASSDDREQRLMLDSLSRLAAPKYALEHLALAFHRPQVVRALMLSPVAPGLPSGPDLGDGLPGPLGGGGPRVPVLPDPKKDFLDLIEKLFPKSPSDLFPTKDWPIGAREPCLITAMAQVADAQRRAPSYVLESLSDPTACPGQFLKLRGTGFGTTGTVLFPGPDGPIPAVSVAYWTDTEIAVLIPEGATSGIIGLQILVDNLLLCGTLWPVYRVGNTAVTFEGGVATIFYFTVNGADDTTDVEPGEGIVISYRTNTGFSSRTRLRIWNGGTPIQTWIAAGGTRAHSFPLPSAATPQTFRVVLRAEGPCGAPVEKSVTVHMQRHPNLSILGVEVTQAIQRFDLAGARNNVRLCAQRRTVVRAHVASGLFDGFDFGAGPNKLPGITGTVRLWRDGVPLDTVPPMNAGMAALPAGQINRTNIGDTLNFMLPVGLLFRRLTLEVKVEMTGPFARDRANYRALNFSTTVEFEQPAWPKLNLVRLRVGANGMLAPSIPNFSNSLSGTLSRYPIPADGFVIHPGSGSMVTGHDLTTREGWEELLDDLEDLAADSDDPGLIWTALVPNLPPPPPNSTQLNGAARSHQTAEVFGITVWEQYPCLAAQSLLPATFAHELAHVLGFEHGPCPLTPPNVPEDIDWLTPPATENDSVGLDTYASPLVTVSPGTGEIMTYCGGESRWPSIKTWERMFPI